MRLQSKHLSMIVQAFGLLILSLSVVTAQKGNNQTTDGLTGATKTKGAVSGLLDKSIMSTRLVGPSGRTELDRKRDNEKINKKFRSFIFDNNYIYNINNLFNESINDSLKRGDYVEALADLLEYYASRGENRIEPNWIDSDQIKINHEISKSQVDGLLSLQEDKISEFIDILKGTIHTDQIRPEYLFFTELQTFTPVSGSGGSYFFPSILLSIGRTGTDIGGQSDIGPTAGYGISLRQDIQPQHRQFVADVYAYNDLASSIKRITTLLKTFQKQIVEKKPAPGQQKDELEKAFFALDTSFKREYLLEEKATSLEEELVSLSKAPQLSFLYSYHAFEGASDLNSAGLSLASLIGGSKKAFKQQQEPDGTVELVPDIRQGRLKRPQWGLTGLVNIQGTSFGSQSAVQTDLALILQNATLYNYRDEDNEKVKVGGRWSWEFGIEYRPKNVVDRGDLLDGFVRYRDTRHNLETTISVGKNADNSSYVGFSVAKSIAF